MSRAVKARLLGVRSLVHRAVFAGSGGHLLATWGGLPVVLLTTTGRRTGVSRTTILVSPLCIGETIVLVASDGGATRHPGWFLNLCTCPGVEVVFRGRRMHMQARPASRPERDSLWPQIAAVAPSYARYQTRTAREIPVVLVEPVERAR